MHELGIAQSIVDIVRQYVPPERGAGVGAIRVRVGELAGVVVDSLEFCFSAVVAGTPYSGAQLTVERVPAICRCDACGGEFVGPGWVFATCPACGDQAVRLLSGGELQVLDVEVDETRAEAQAGGSGHENCASAILMT